MVIQVYLGYAARNKTDSGGGGGRERGALSVTCHGSLAESKSHDESRVSDWLRAGSRLGYCRLQYYDA